MATRWGILGVGDCSRDFINALLSQDPDDHQLVAVAAASLDEVKAFGENHGVKKVYGSYEELLKNSDIDIVFIGSNQSELHKQSLFCLNAGKNVLCSAPVSTSLSASKEVFSLAREKKLFFMEAYWSRFFPVYDKVRKELASGSLGDVINTQASVCENVIDRKSSGALLKVGIVAVMLSDMIFKERPLKIQASGQNDDNGVDTGGAVILTYSGERTASLVYSLVSQSLDNSFVINGTQGSIKVEPPCWCPTHLTTSSGEFEFPLPECTGPMSTQHSEGLVYQQNCVRQCLQQGLTECPEMSLSSSENIQYILETVAQQLGIKYD